MADIEGQQTGESSSLLKKFASPKMGALVFGAGGFLLGGPVGALVGAALGAAVGRFLGKLFGG